MADINYYQILGVAFDATNEEIKAAYRRLAFELHPDRNPTEQAALKFQDVMQAYAVLINAESRAEYDAKHLSFEEISGGEFGSGIDLDQLFTKPASSSTPGVDEFAKYLKRSRRRKFIAQAITAISVIFLFLSFGLRPVNTAPTQSNSQGNNQGGNQVAETSTSNTQSGGTVKPGLNQRLIIVQGLQGPIGLPGPAGPSGKDGRDGPAGAAGVAGAAGEMGPIGPAGAVGQPGAAGAAGAAGVAGQSGVAGAGVTVTTFSGAQGGCTDGGTKFTVLGQSDTYACNGTGGSGSGGSSFGAGYAGIGSCDTSVQISFSTDYDSISSNELKLTAIVVYQLAGACDGNTLRAIIKIKSPKDSTENFYESGHSYECSTVLSLDSSSGVNANSVALTSNDCVNTTTNAATFNSIWATDIDGSTRSFLIQIS